MMDGTIIKQIREDKGLTLEATYFNICSKTNAIAFERGKRMLAADKFMQVLDNLMVSLDEFKWIADNYQLSEQAFQEHLLKYSWNVGEMTKFESQLQIGEQVGLNELKLASFRLLYAYATEKTSGSDDLALVSHYFAELSSWTLFDLKLFTNIGYVLPFSSMISLLHEALKAKQRYKNYPGSDALFATLLINCLERTFDEAKPNISVKLLTQLAEFTQGIQLAGYRLFERYYWALYKYSYGDKKAGKQALLEVEQLAKALDVKLVVEKSKKILQ